jgi:uncharacterized membrane protein
MHVALVFIGAIVGLALNSGVGSGTLFSVLLGGFAGYALGELYSLRTRGAELEKDVRALKERLAAMQRQQGAMELTQRAMELEEQRRATGSAGAPDAGAAEASSADTPSRSPVPPRSPITTASPAPAPSAGPSWSRAAVVASGAASATSVTAASDTASASTSPGRSNTPGHSRSPASDSHASIASGSASYASRRAADVTGEPDPIVRVIREFFAGGNTLVRVGVLILFFGVAFLLRYLAEHTHVPIQFRLSGVACGGIALLILGWRLRLRRPGYALALQGGGVGILYLTAFAALRLYSLLPPAAGFAIFVLLAAFSAVLAVLQDSQAFALLAVTGGFLAPILASTGQGSHVVLFSYYAIVNASILVIAWYKAWRPLNFAGFAFTFIISTAWGALHYNSSLFASTEPFLVLFFVLYVAIAILFSVRQPPQLRGYVDGTLVFGTPMAAFGYQSAMLHDRPMVLALSAIIVGAAYFLLAWVLHRQQRSSQRLLVEAFMALGVVFFTVATPLALDGRQTGATWALEAAALVWIGVRQSRVLPRLFGVILQIVAGILLWNDVDLFVGAQPSFAACLARVLAAIAAVFSAAVLRKHAERLRSYEDLSAPLLFFFGLAVWLANGFLEIDRYVPNGYGRSVALAFVAATAVASSELSRRTALSFARLPALWLLPALIAFAAEAPVAGVAHPAAQGGWLVWPLAFAAFYVICRRHEGEPEGVLASWLHAISAWLLLVLLTWEVHWIVDQMIGGRGSWSAVGLMLVPAGVLYALPRLVERISWPLQAHRPAYMVFAASGIAAYLAFWSIGTNLTLTGDPYPFPYVPLLNALDMAQLITLLGLWEFWRYLRATDLSADKEVSSSAPVVLLTALAFVWLNAALLRTLHQWVGVPFDLDAMIQSTLVETALSIFWTVLALATMLVATRRTARGAWVTGAVLLAVTIVKLFVVDLSRVGTVERIVSFIAVGLLTLVIGYFSPLPPAAREHRTSLS